MSRIRKSLTQILAVGVVFAGFIFQANAQTNSANQLSGNYRLDTSKSENVSEIVDNASRNNRVSSTQREDLEDKLEAPETISIDIRGNQVTLSSSVSSSVTFTADGRTQNVNNNSGSNVRVRASLRNNELKISSLGGDSDYTITMNSNDGGRTLRVTRMVTTNYLRQTIFADSYYNREGSYSGNRNDNYPNDDGYSSSDSSDDGYSSSDPNDDGYIRNDPNGSTNDRNYPQTTRRNGNFYIPNGAVLTGTLENKITTEASQNNDRFRMTVESPREYQGAVIEGYLSGIERSGKATGSSKLTLNFETIRLRNGRTYDFAGVLQSITDTQGKTIKINDEGEVKGDSKTKESVKRGGIGAGLGAIIGGIIGGGKGAIIGATIGGGAGAGSVIAQGKEDVEIEQGSQISVQSTSPDRR